MNKIVSLRGGGAGRWIKSGNQRKNNINFKFGFIYTSAGVRFWDPILDPSNPFSKSGIRFIYKHHQAFTISLFLYAVFRQETFPSRLIRQILNHSIFVTFRMPRGYSNRPELWKVQRTKDPGSWDMHWDSLAKFGMAWSLKGKMLFFNFFNKKLGTYRTTRNLPFSFLFTYNYSSHFYV